MLTKYWVEYTLPLLCSSRISISQPQAGEALQMLAVMVRPRSVRVMEISCPDAAACRSCSRSFPGSNNSFRTGSLLSGGVVPEEPPARGVRQAGRGDPARMNPYCLCSRGARWVKRLTAVRGNSDHRLGVGFFHFAPLSFQENQRQSSPRQDRSTQIVQMYFRASVKSAPALSARVSAASNALRTLPSSTQS